MRTLDIAEAIGPDVLIGRPESLAIGPIDRDCAVITYPKINGEKAAARSGRLGGESAIGEFPNPHRQVLAARRLHPGKAQVALLILSHGRHLDRHARTRINHALLDQFWPVHIDLIVQALWIYERIRSDTGGHGSKQASRVEVNLSGCRVRKGGHTAAGLISSGGVVVRRDWQRRVREGRRAAEVFGHLGDTDGVT